MPNTQSFSIIFLCGGSGSRAKLSLPKQYHLLERKPLFHYSLETLLALSPVQLCVVCEEKYQSFFLPYGITVFALPGPRRQDSTEQGLSALTTPVDYVLVHDSARPFIRKSDALKLLDLRGQESAAALGTKAVSTLRQGSKTHYSVNVIPRDDIWQMQTPQLIKTTTLQQGLDLAKQRQLTITDDVCCAELLGQPVKLLEGSPSNIKITTPEDISYAEFVLKQGSL